MVIASEIIYVIDVVKNLLSTVSDTDLKIPRGHSVYSTVMGLLWCTEFKYWAHNAKMFGSKRPNVNGNAPMV